MNPERDSQLTILKSVQASPAKGLCGSPALRKSGISSGAFKPILTANSLLISLLSRAVDVSPYGSEMSLLPRFTIVREQSNNDQSESASAF